MSTKYTLSVDRHSYRHAVFMWTNGYCMVLADILSTYVKSYADIITTHHFLVFRTILKQHLIMDKFEIKFIFLH